MKKAIVIFLFPVYGAAAMGTTVHLHYCMNKFIGWSLSHNHDQRCDKCGMKEQKDGCCKDEHQQVKLKTEHQQSVVDHLLFLTATPAIIPPVVTAEQTVSVLHKVSPVSNAPPGKWGERRYLLCRTLLI